MRVASVANREDADLGHVGEALTSRGARIDVIARDDPSRLADAVGTPDVLVLLGSDWSVHDPTRATEVEAERALVRDAVQRGTPVLAICYGAQLAASALGCAVTRAARPEVGWYTVDTTDAALIAPGPWFQLHYDRWWPTESVSSLAMTEDAPQAFRHARLLAVQFHPEVTPATGTRWLQDGAGAIRAAGFDIDQIAHELDQRADEARRRADDLVDTFLETVAGSLVRATGGDKSQ